MEEVTINDFQVLEIDKPPSPVLSGGKVCRKYLQYKRKKERSRVKLIDRFPEEIPEDTKENCYNFNDVTASQDEKALESLQSLEDKRSEQQRKPEDSEFVFMKPTTPAPSCSTNETVGFVGFKTALGRKIEVFSDESIRKAKSLFDDILNPTEFGENSRTNKYAFLSKATLYNTGYEDNKRKSIKSQNKSFTGFKTAAGKNIAINNDALKIAEKIFVDVSKFLVESHNHEEKENNLEDSLSISQESDHLFTDLTILEDIGESVNQDEVFKKKNDTHPSERNNKDTLSKLESCSEEITLKDSDKLQVSGFKSASGKTIVISESALNFVKSMLDQNFEMDSNMSHFGNCESQFSSCKTELLADAINQHENKTCILKNTDCKGFDKETIEDSQKYTDRFCAIVTQFSKSLNRKNSGSSVIATKTRIAEDFYVRKITQCGRTKDCEGTLPSALEYSEELDYTLTNTKYEYVRSVNPNELQMDTNFKPDNLKPKVGFQITKDKSIDMSEDALYKAPRLLTDTGNSSSSILLPAVPNNTIFEPTRDANSSAVNTSIKKKRLGRSTYVPFHVSKNQMERVAHLFNKEKLDMISPVKLSPSIIYNSTPLKTNVINHDDLNLTPIKNVSVCSTESHFEEGEDIVICETTKGDLESWQTDLQTEMNSLEAKLKTLARRKQALNAQKHYLDNGSFTQRKNGVLYDKKLNCRRIPLKEFITPTFSNRRARVTPKNAELVHFTGFQPNLPFILTLDGASIIPNVQNHVGLAEVTVAFKVMPGVESRLIPNGWIRNHFKWIVWKLSSYEIFGNLRDCLTLENVVQQLKYRYDCEIDRAKRSTLRRIFEADDAPQKRLVLCVSNIFFNVKGKVELELTDGWYCIRTLLDDVLSEQVSKKKIDIGTKLITCGAELVGCTGCHPLEANEDVRLKINCNSTRRALWDVKLGYQKHCEPYPIQLSSIFANGGAIGCIKVYIARVYPIIFAEKMNNLWVWRNKNAEEIRAQQWESNQWKEVQAVRERIMKDQRIQKVKRKNVYIREADWKNVDCPETLYDLYQNSNDPEGFHRLLSSSQQHLLVEYQRQLSFAQQQKISREIQSGVESLNVGTRDVSPVLQFRVVDVLDPKEKDCLFQIWKPSETHLELIKELMVFYIYNVLPKKTGGLSAMGKTRFKQETSQEYPQYNKYKRVIVPISEISNSLWCNEFDTVGIVVQITVNSFDQSIWLTDEQGRLLLINVFDGPKNCLFDKIEIGQLIAASNLIYYESKIGCKEAVANRLTVLSRYPQDKHLQDGIDLFSKKFTKNLQEVLNECNEKIDYFRTKAEILRVSRFELSGSSVTSKSSSLNPDLFYDSSDISDSVLSTIDVDKYS